MARSVVLLGVVASVLVAAAAPAAADPGPVLEPGLPDRSGLPDPGLHLELGFGADLGYYSVGSEAGFGGLHALLGLSVDRVALLGELDGALVGQRLFGVEDGEYGRAALEARLSLWRGKVPESRRLHHPPDALARGELWLEPGIGYEWASQLAGPALARADVSLAIGYQQSQHFAGWWAGTYAAVRVIAANAPSTQYDSGRDLSVLFTTGLVFGK
jgi:hypothetical protein